MSRTAREGTQEPLRRNHVDKEEYRDEEDDFFNLVEEERQYWCEVDKLHDQIEEVKGCVIASNMEKRSQLGKLPGKDGTARRNTRTNHEFRQRKAEWPKERQKSSKESRNTKGKVGR